MKKNFHLYLLLLFTVACTTQPQPTQGLGVTANSTLTSVPAPSTTGGDQKPSVRIEHIDLKATAQACTTDAEYFVSAKISGAANAQVSYTVTSNNNNGTPSDGATIMLDNNGGYEVNGYLKGPFYDPANVQVAINVFVNEQAVNYAYDFICTDSVYQQ